MMEKRMSWYMVAMLLVVTTTLVAARGSGRSGGGGGESGNSVSTNCVNQLAPCLNYLNGRGRGRGDGDDPAASCCEPLKEVIKKKGECLCSLISNEGSAQAEQAGINITLAQQLPACCGQHVNPISCLHLRQGSSHSNNNNNNNIPNSAMTILLLPCWNLFLYLYMWLEIVVVLTTVVT